MNWHMAAKELPEFDEDVLVAFDNGACVVACRCFDDDSNKLFITRLPPKKN